MCAVKLNGPTHLAEYIQTEQDYMGESVAEDIKTLLDPYIAKCDPKLLPPEIREFIFKTQGNPL